MGKNSQYLYPTFFLLITYSKVPTIMPTYGSDLLAKHRERSSKVHRPRAAAESDSLRSVPKLWFNNCAHNLSKPPMSSGLNSLILT